MKGLLYFGSTLILLGLAWALMCPACLQVSVIGMVLAGASIIFS